MAKNNKIIYDPKYARLYGNIGQSMRRSTAEDLRTLARADAASNINYNPEYTSEYALTGGPGYYQPDNLENIDNTENEKGWLDKTSEFIGQELYNLYSIPQKLRNFDYTSAWNLIVKKQLQARLGNEEEQLQNLKQEQQDLLDFSDFVDKYNQYKRDIQNLRSRQESGDIYGAQLLQKDIESKYQGFQDQINYYTQAIRTNPTLQSMMYNTTASNLKDNTRIGAKVIYNALDHVSEDQPSNPVLRFFNKAIQGAANFADFVTNPSSERHTRAAIARGALNDDDLSKLQKYNINNLNGSSLQAFKNEINKRLKTLQPDVDEQQSVVNDTLNLYRKGSWFYNPKSIDKTFEEKNSTNSPIADLHEKGIDALLYSLPEIGSSFSSIEAFMSQLGIQWVGGAVSKTLATKSPIAGLVAQVATQLGSLATAYAMRKDETNSDATDAYLQRVQDSSIRNRINLGRILNITKQFCKSNGIETDGLNEQDLLQLALSYNIQTGDSEFEKIKRDTRQGINKLKAQNNALGYMDYIEVLPFAGSSGSIIKNYADNIARKMVYKKSLKYTADDVFDATANLAENSITSETKRRLAQSWISKKIDGVLKKHGGTIESQIAKRNLFNSALDLGKKTSFVATKEGLEEGQQAFLQNRYLRGLYDEESPDYDYGRGIDLRSLMDNLNLATEAALAYFGLDFGDPLNGDDQLRQQMEIGALTSLWFGLGHLVLANATNNPESLRRFVSQYKFDKNLMRYVANNYKQQLDDVHLGMFFDRFKNGGNAELIEKSYDAFKYLKNDDVIKDQDLDDDVSLAKTAYGIYKTTTNKKNTILSDLNIAKDSEDHKEYVKQASRVIFDFKNVSELVNRSNHDLMTSILDIIRNVKEYKEGESTDIENEALLKSFKELLQKTYVSDQKKNNDRISLIDKDLEKLHDRYHKSLTRPVLTDESEIQKQKEADEAREKEYQEKIKPLNDEKEKLTGELELSQDDYLDRIVTTLISLKQISILKGLYKLLDTQKDKLSEIKKAFGYKLNIESLYGMKNAIKEQIEKLEKQYKPIVEKGDNKKLLDKYKDLVDDQSLSEKIVVDALNKGILQSLSPKYQAYVFNAVDPRSIAYALPRVKWENLTDDQRTDFLNNLIRKMQSRGENTDNIDFKKEWINRNRRTNLSASILKKKRSDIEQNRGTDKGMLPIDEQEAIEKIDKDAALLVIGQDMSDRFRRKQMVRLEKEQNAPLTIEDLDNANDGDKKAQQKISDAAKQQLEDGQKQASEKSKQQLDKSDIDAHLRQIDDARKKVYGEKSDELTESAKRKAKKATLTNSALDRLINKNVEGGLNGINTESVGNVLEEGNVQEEDEQLRISNQNELKRQAFIKAIELLRNKPKDDTTDPSTYIQEKLNIPEEWADEFVDAYNAILKKELQELTGATTTQNPEEQQGDSQISDENNLTEPKIEETSDEQVTANTQEGLIVNNDDNIGQIGAEVGVEILDDGTVKIISPVMQEETPQNGEVNLNTGEHTDKSLIDEVAPDESGDEGDSNKKEEQKELHDSSMDNTAIGQLATMLQNNLLINIDVAKNIARQFIENWVRGLSFDDCINNMEESARTKFDIIDVLKVFYNTYPIPQAKDLIIDPVQNTLDLNKIDADDAGNVTYSGKQIKDDLLVFSGLSDMYDSQVDESKVSAERSVVESKIGNPFNYAPDSTKPMVFKHNKTPLFTDKRMATGSELNQKLSIPGWFGRISKMYYIVSGFDKSKADDLTVALIMEDPDDSNVIYNVSMRRPSSKSFRMGEESDLLHIIKRLKFLNVNTQLYEALLNNAVESSTTAYNLKNKTQLSEKEWCQKFNSEYQRLQELCRLQSPISNSLKVFTNNEIEDYLQRLREQRNQIIDAYCIKNEDGTYSIPQNVREDIQPQNVLLTNGGLNNLRNDVGIPIQRTIFGEDGGFGLSSTIDGISEDIENGSVLFGVGTGPFGENPGPNRIRPINGTAEEIPGTGKAGKLYIKVPEESQPGTSKKQVYAQLSELKFGPDLERNEDDIEESFTLDGVADLKNPPSLAEIAFRLILGRVDKQSVILGRRGLNTIGLSDDTIEALSDLLINHGKQTLIGIVKPDEFGNIKPSLKNAYLSHILGFYSDKQLAYIEHVDGTSSFYIGDRDDQGKAFLHEYKIQDFFPGENASQEILDQCAKNRRHVISLIERNMHWNTNLERLMSTLDNAALYSVLDQYFFDDKKQRKTSNGKPISTFNPFGNSDFSFEYDDFYNQDGSRKNPIMLAWMIKNGKITTDVGTNNNDMFRAPYVFVNGIKTAALPKPQTPQKTKLGNKPKTKIEKVIQKSNEQESKKKDVPNVTFVIPDDEAYKNVTVDEKGDIKTYLITATTIGKTGKQLGWNKSNAEKLKQAMLDKFAELEKAGIKIDGASMKVFNTYKKFKGFNVFLHVKEDGTAQLTIDFQTKPTKVGGVYSQKRGKGKIDTQSAKTWLLTALGLSDDQVLVTNGVMRGLYNEKVYALTNIACSQIVDSVYGFITLSKKGGIGLEYHEAWHYVNLLLHNRTMRSKIYEKYRSTHPELKGATFREIEEYLAEDFRSYMLGFEDKTWSARIKRFFKNIKQIVKAFFGKPDVIYQAYKNIKNGKYAGAKLDPQSVKEFKLNFPEGIYFEIPGLTNDQVTKFTNILNYHQYYQCAKLLCNKVMEGLDLSSVSKLKNYSKEDFDAIFAGIQQLIDNDPESENSKLLQDVVDNKDAFYKTVSTMLKTFSIDVKHKKLKLDADITNGKDTGDVADNIWDIDHMEVSKKINVGFKAKLFFSTIPVYDVKTDEHGELVYTPNIDPLFGSLNYWSFSKGWNKIMSELWSCDNFDGIDDSTGQYSSTSLIGMVQRLSKSGDKFFRAMEEKLEPLIDEDDESLSPEEKLEIKTQILNTIQSSKNRISVLSINAPKYTAKKQDVSNQIMLDNALGIDDEAVSKTPDILIDINKLWVIQDSEHLLSKYILARTWSENLLSGSGIVETDPKTGDNFVSTAYMRKLKQLINTATQAVVVQKTQTQNFAKNTKYKSIEDAKSAICCVLNYMAIPADGQVIQQLINTELSLNPNSYPETDLAEKERHVLREMLNGSGTATILKLYGQLSTANRGKTITIGKNGEKDLSDFYKGYSTVMSRVKGKKTTKGLPWIGKLTVAYAKTYPSSAEMSVTGANGALIYPINQNNAVSDFLHRLQNDINNELEKKKATSYTQGSIIVENAENDRVYSTPEEEKLHLNTFVCVKDMESGNSGDYFGITPLEDYVAKFIMTYNKHLTFPTMADKKTWYSITSKWLTDNLNTDVILTNSENPKLSTGTIDIFSRYFYDELKSLKEYYAKDNIKALLKDPNKLLVNFHGSIVTNELDLPGNKKYKYTHLDFNGNGGKFRYFYDISKFDGLNLNQKLELEYKTEYLENVKRAAIGDTASITDGFERIRIFLDGILKEDAESQEYTKSVEQLRNSINAMLLEKVKAEIDVLSSDENMHLIQHVGDNYFNYGLPNDILKYYQNQIKEQLGDVDGDTLRNSAIYSAIANHVLRTMISIIEVEKIFTGDPAMYKWITYKDKQLSETTKNSLTKKVTLEDGSVEQVQVSMLQSKDVDKIKRLGAVLSPGTNLKTQWTNSEKEMLKDFGTSKYTFMNVSDINVKSVFLDDIRTIFTQNELVQALKRSYDDKYIIEHFSKALNLDPENVKRVEKIYYTIYSHPEYIDKIFKILQNTKGDTIVENIKSRVDDSISPYDGINVADAQVCLRPSIYRKLRIATGEWSFSEDETGYSDEKAYDIIENDDDWMSDPEKYEIGRKLMLKPLKMSYFSNSTTTNIGIYNVSLPVYNKMAMFPMFKYVCLSSVGRALYERMNMPGNEIDMFGFDSAVKVGCNQNRYLPYKKGTTDLSTMDMESLKLPSNASINYQTGEVRQALPGKKTLAVLILDMNNLHLLLNTDAHEHDERSIGSQMMKICFSNVDPNMRYGKDGQKGEGRLGSAIRNDIMNIINAMTQIGTDNIKKRFFKKDREGKYTIPNKQRIQDYVLSICENNDLGLSSEEIIRSGGKVASLTARLIFEQSVSSMINKEVIDINTNGGAAIQQSCFGFVGHGRSGVLSEKTIHNVSLYSAKVKELNLSVRLLKVLQAGKIETINDILNNKDYIQSHLGKKLQSEVQDILDDFELSWEDGLTEEQLKNAKFSKRHVLNNGEPLRWYNKKGTMEVMLSLNFFRLVIPEKYKTDYTTMRQWLIDNDVINGTKSDGTRSNPKPFGVGYRIPTQGMSSTFGFIVADVLPETSSDLIVVPTEFTAQTGSDFDVDKLYLATYSYKQEGDTSVRYKTSSKSDMKYVDYLNEDVGALRNKLLDNYIDIIADYKNTADARASIDVLTSKLKSEIIPFLSNQTTRYAESMYELLPSFQARRKMEYSTGKSGIGPFALNVTNLAMTLAVGLKMKFGENDKLLNECFDFGNINDVVGKDGYMISAWLSAMVNAHVDVAKDPYILNLNVNSATYKYTNFLLRTGQGMATFTLLAQPALKRMASMIINSKGMYGLKLGPDAREISNRRILKQSNEIRGSLMREYIRSFLKLYDHLYQSEAITESQKQNLKKWSACIKKDPKTLRPNVPTEYIIDGDAKSKKILYTDPELRLLDISVAKSFLKMPTIEEPYKFAKWLMFLAMALLFIGDISKASNLLSDLVSNSRIDTKKFGNNIISQLNFLNGYNNFKNDDDANKYFYIEDGREHKELPMYTYFEHTFLDKKLRNATLLTRGLLRNQTFTATPLFGVVFNSTMATIFGDVVYRVPKGFDEKGKRIYEYKFGYKKVMDDKQIQDIGKALESIFRHRAFLSYCSQLKESFDDVDLSVGNNENAAKQKIVDLLYGNDKKPSVARRLSIMKAMIKQLVFEKIQNEQPLPDWLSQLCDDNGVIKNDFLEYLNPILDKTGAYVDRIVLASSSMDTDSQDKSKLQSAFSELLDLLTSSTNDQDIQYVKAIQNLAKDLVLYAYYTTYNNGGVNQFFELVPPVYRKTYDTAIKKALSNANYNNDEMASVILHNSALKDLFGAVSVLNILDVLCKNFWKNENIVPTYTRRQKSTSVFSPAGEVTIKAIERGNQLNGLRLIPIALALPALPNDGYAGVTAPYIKIQYGGRDGEMFLFKKIGVLYKVKKNEKTGKETRSVFKTVYEITNKLGLQDGKNKQFEFFSDDTSSIFRDNNLNPMIGSGDKVTPGTPISLTEQEITNLLNIERSNKNNGGFKQLGKETIRLEYEAYRPITLNDTEITTSEQELLNDEIESGVLKDLQQPQTDNDNLKESAQQQKPKTETELKSEQLLQSELSQEEQQLSEETQELEPTNTEDDSTGDIGSEISLTDLLLSGGFDLSGLPEVEQEEMSELDKKEAEERKKDCKE